jgi:hypothetical protein
MDMTLNVTSKQIVGVLTSVASAKKPQDIEVTPSSEDVTITADEGYYIRSVTVKAVSSTGEETGGTSENDNDGTASGNQG